MSKKHDDLLRLAFGELSAESARTVEARADGDPSARAELAAMRALRADLQRLPPPPPDNLSAERLRAAILDRDLRQRRPAPFGWAWAPVMAASLAAFLFVRRADRVPGEVQIVANPTASVALQDKEGSELAFPDIRFDVPPVAKEAMSAPAEARRESLALRRRHRPASEVRARPLYAMVTPSSDEDAPPPAPPAPKEREPETMAAPTSSVVEGTPYSGGPENVVLVSSKRDLDTGAHAATETEASNVLVGG